jgi:hypothetical protein
LSAARPLGKVGRTTRGTTLIQNPEEAMRRFALTVLLLVLVGFAFAEDDPEPPATPLRKLQGTWTSVRRIAKGVEMAYTQITFTFDKDKVTSNLDFFDKDKVTSVKTDRKRPDLLEMTQDQRPTRRFFFKVEKGELYLAQDRTNDPKAKPDFSGQTELVMILKREKDK